MPHLARFSVSIVYSFVTELILLSNMKIKSSDVEDGAGATRFTAATANEPAKMRCSIRQQMRRVFERFSFIHCKHGAGLVAVFWQRAKMRSGKQVSKALNFAQRLQERR